MCDVSKDWRCLTFKFPSPLRNSNHWILRCAQGKGCRNTLSFIPAQYSVTFQLFCLLNIFVLLNFLATYIFTISTFSDILLAKIYCSSGLTRGQKVVGKLLLYEFHHEKVQRCLQLAKQYVAGEIHPCMQMVFKLKFSTCIMYFISFWLARVRESLLRCNSIAFHQHFTFWVTCIYCMW